MTEKTPRDIIASQSGSNCSCPRCSAGYADAVIAELEAEGHRVVQVEPTAEMVVAGDEAAIEVLNDHSFAVREETLALKVWRAMLAAAPK